MEGKENTNNINQPEQVKPVPMETGSWDKNKKKLDGLIRKGQKKYQSNK